MDYLQYFNINDVECEDGLQVLNLIINGLPSIHVETVTFLSKNISKVLNLIINGLPSILWFKDCCQSVN